jgi:NADH-quinone oxidoreductase subunit H
VVRVVPDYIWWIIEILIFPGFAFMAFMIVLTQWIHRKVGARVQYRRGPMYTGKFGFLQPFADFMKLLLKEDSVSKYSMKISPLIGLSIGVGAIFTLMIMMPIAFKPIYSFLDIIVFLYLSLLASLAILYLAISSPNPYTSLGVGRYLALLVSAEPAFAASMLVPVFIGASRYSSEFSLYRTSIISSHLWSSSVASFIAMLIAAAAAFIAMMGILEIKPFDFPEAEGEIYWGVFTEYGGPRLALAFFILFMERIVIPIAYTLLFLGGSWPVDVSHNYALGTFVILLKYVVLFIVLAVIDNVMPRFRPDQGVKFLLKYAVPLSFLALVAAILV